MRRYHTTGRRGPHPTPSSKPAPQVSAPIWLKTVAASTAAALWRIFIMPIDSIKTMMQVEGKILNLES